MAAAPRHLTAKSCRALVTRIGLIAGFLCLLHPLAARAQIGSYRYASIVVDDASGRVTEAANADSLRYPASLTKLMTLYMAFEAMRDHRIALNQNIPISVHAASMEPTKLGLLPGALLTVNDAILAIVTKSANDAACALGELVGGDEDRFAQMMTMRARALGMTHSTFRNASGLPDPEQTTTARDLALLAHHLVEDFPIEYHYFSVPEFYYRGRIIPNHDRMLVDYEGADGLKTGYTVASGHNLVTSALRGGVRLIGVVMGAASNPERDAHMASLLDDGFVQLGVPVTPRPPRRLRLPSLIAEADAAPLRPRLVSFHLGTIHAATLHWHGHGPAARQVQLALHRPTHAAAAHQVAAHTASSHGRTYAANTRTHAAPSTCAKHHHACGRA